MEGDRSANTLTARRTRAGQVPAQARSPVAREATEPSRSPSVREATEPSRSPNVREATEPLSKEQVAERLFDAFNRRDLLGALALVHREIVFRPMTATVSQGGEPYRGHEGMRRYVEDVERYWEELIVNPVQIRAAGRAVVALGMVSGRGAGGAIEDVPTTWVMKFRDGLVVDAQIFSDERHVARALGASA